MCVVTLLVKHTDQSSTCSHGGCLCCMGRADRTVPIECFGCDFVECCQSAKHATKSGDIPFIARQAGWCMTCWQAHQVCQAFDTPCVAQEMGLHPFHGMLHVSYHASGLCWVLELCTPLRCLWCKAGPQLSCVVCDSDVFLAEESN